MEANKMAWGGEISETIKRKMAIHALNTAYKALYEAKGFSSKDFIELENKIENGGIDAYMFQHEHERIINGMREVKKILLEQGKDSIEISLIERIISCYETAESYRG